MKVNTLLFSFLLFLSSCFEVVEELDLKDDSSGVFTYTINMSQSKLEINTALKLDTFMGVKIPNEFDIRRDMEKAKGIFTAGDGITSASYTVDFNNYIFIYKINFDSISALNSALGQAYLALSRKGNPILRDKLIMPSNILTRVSGLDSIGRISKLNEKKKEALKEATYICVYRFESAVTEVTNKNARTSKNGKAVMLRSNMKSLMNKETTLTNNITISKP